MAKRPRLALAIFCLVVLVVPAVAGRAIVDKTPFNPKPRDVLRAQHPDYVFIGNSMVESRIDLPTIERLTGGKAALLSGGGTTSARWYLFFKNYLVASGVKPKRVFIFFRDWNISLPRHRIAAEYRAETEQAMDGDDPVVQGFMDAEDRRTGLGPIMRILDRIYPLQRRGSAVRDAVREDLIDQAAGGKKDRDEVVDDLDDTFGLGNLRRDIPTDMSATEDESEPEFSADPADSFLPHIVALAKSADIPLTLVRVKRRPNADGPRPESDKLRSYVDALSAYLAEEGVGFRDESTESEIPLSWYADGDHIAPERRAEYSKLFYEKLRSLFD